MDVKITKLGNLTAIEYKNLSELVLHNNDEENVFTTF